MKKITVYIFLVVFGLTASYAKTYEACFKKAAKKHGVPLDYLLAVSFTESSFRHSSRNSNRNGTADYGLMQINSIWAKEAHKYGYSWNKIKKNACTNIMFGSLILKNNKKRLGSWKKAIGAYNAGFASTPKAKKRRLRYYKKVLRNRAIAKKHIKRLKRKV